MKSVFSMDSKVMQFMSRVGDLILLNLLFLMTSIPIITIGASSTALYTVCFHFGTPQEDGTTKSYFKAFRDNFKQSTILWLILLLIGVPAILYVDLFLRLCEITHSLYLVFIFISVLALMTYLYTFPLVSQFYNTNWSTLKNALFFSIGHFPSTLAIALLHLLPLIVLRLSPTLFLYTGIFWIILHFSTAAYFSARMFRKNFSSPYPTEPQDDDET